MASSEDIAHLLSRVGFGGTRAEVEALVPLSWADAVDRVLDTSRAPSWQGGPSLPAPGTNVSGEAWGQAYSGMVNWWIERARTTPVPVVERMALFWHSHLPSSLDVVDFALLWDQNRLYRRRGLGRLDDLIQPASVHPAMLIYLDNRANVAGWPNENFARELMELFLLGVGQYTETDVKEAARAWTGHTLDKDTFAYRFRSDWHDHGAKTFLGDTRAWDGPQIVDHLIRGPKQRVVARFIARKLWRHLAYDNPSAALVEELATAFVAGDMRISALLRAILLRPEFRSTTARRGVVRSPFEFVVATLKHLGMRATDVNPQWILKGMGQELFRPPNVDGWGTGDYWISTSTAWARSQFADGVAWKVHESSRFQAVESMSPEEAADHVLAALGVFHASASTRAALVDYVRAERASRRWAQRWGLTTLVLMSPEFQLA